MKEIFEGFKCDDNCIQKLKAGDETTERHFVSYFGALLQIKIRRHLACADHVEDIQRETLAGVLAAIRFGSDVPNPERLGAVVNGVCNKLLRDFHALPLGSKPMGDLPIDCQEKAMDTESTERVFIRGLVQQVLHRLPSKDRQILRTAVVKDRYNGKDEIAENPGASKDYLRILLFRTKQQFAADRGRGSRVTADFSD